MAQTQRSYRHVESNYQELKVLISLVKVSSSFKSCIDRVLRACLHFPHDLPNMFEDLPCEILDSIFGYLIIPPKPSLDYHCLFAEPNPKQNQLHDDYQQLRHLIALRYLSRKARKCIDRLPYYLYDWFRHLSFLNSARANFHVSHRSTPWGREWELEIQANSQNAAEFIIAVLGLPEPFYFPSVIICFRGVESWLAPVTTRLQAMVKAKKVSYVKKFMINQWGHGSRILSVDTAIQYGGDCRKRPNSGSVLDGNYMSKWDAGWVPIRSDIRWKAIESGFERINSLLLRLSVEKTLEINYPIQCRICTKVEFGPVVFNISQPPLDLTCRCCQISIEIASLCWNCTTAYPCSCSEEFSPDGVDKTWLEGRCNAFLCSPCVERHRCLNCPEDSVATFSPNCPRKSTHKCR